MGLMKKVKKYKLMRKVKFEEIAKKWLEMKKISIKESTYYNYMFIIDKYLMPTFKDVSLHKLVDYNYNEFVQKLKINLSVKTVRDIGNVLKSILKYSQEEYNFSINLKTINMPKLNITKIKVLNKREKGKLERYCLKQNTLKSLGVIVCLYTGLRIGELCALKWEDVDIEEKIIYVRKTLQRIYMEKENNSKIIINSPKTNSSVRRVPINNKLYEILKPLKKDYKNEDYFLTGSSEKYVEPRNYQNLFKIFLSECKVKPYKFHILRHTFATYCIEVGMDAKSLSEILGHSNVNITLSRYVHSSDKIKKKFLEKL